MKKIVISRSLSKFKQICDWRQLTWTQKVRCSWVQWSTRFF